MLNHNSNYVLSQGLGGHYEVSSSTNKIDEAYGLSVNTSGATSSIGINNTVAKDSTTVGAAIGIDNNAPSEAINTTHGGASGVRTIFSFAADSAEEVQRG